MEPIVNVPIGDYDALRNRVKELEEEIKHLREERDTICDENKVRVIERESEVLYPGGCALRIHVKDELRNFDDVIKTLRDEYEEKLKQAKARADFYEKSFRKKEEDSVDSQKEINDLKCLVERIKNRNLWQRIFDR